MDSEQQDDPRLAWARTRGWENAAAGRLQRVPAYTVTTDPADNSFVALLGKPHLDPVGRAVVAGDLHRRFTIAAAGDPPGRDVFEGLRVPWPGALPEADRSRVCITCPECGWTSHHLMDVRELWCGNCRYWTSDPELAPTRLQSLGLQP